MSKKTSKALPPKHQALVQARRRHRLSHAHVQMARELGMNPKKLGSIDNHDQEPWKEPLPQFIEHLYQKRFGRERPEIVVPIEQHARQLVQKKAERRAAKAAGTRPGRHRAWRVPIRAQAPGETAEAAGGDAI
jgi:hypothetical protein